jgi:hypothetical protein
LFHATDRTNSIRAETKRFEMSKMTQEQLAERWMVSPRTLEQWRWLGRGPVFLKIGARVLYREEDIKAYEAAQICQSTSGPLPLEGR